MTEGEAPAGERTTVKESKLAKILKTAFWTALPGGTIKLARKEIEEEKPSAWKKYFTWGLVGVFETAKCFLYGDWLGLVPKKYSLVGAYA